MMNKKHLVIATRESPLALKQTAIIQASLARAYPSMTTSCLGITTKADKMLEVTLDKIGDKGLFVKELEEALLAGRADCAVHSMKDVPMQLPEGLVIPVITAREDACDAFVSQRYASLEACPPGAIIGTSSVRRQSQLRAWRPDLDYRPLRGNVNTRLAKLDAGEFDAIILAAAGLERMHMASRITQRLPLSQLLPTAGQGALGIECRENDHDLRERLAILADHETQACVSAERAMCRTIGGGCSVPIAAYAMIQAGTLTLRGLVANPQGTRIIRAEATGDPSEAVAVGEQVAASLLAQGAQSLLDECR